MVQYTFRDLHNKEAILLGQFGEIWLFDKTPGDYLYKCYSENTTLMRRILSWEGTKEGASYFRQDAVMITYDVIVPKRLIKRVCRLFNIPLKKDSKKIEAGRRLESKRKSFIS